MTKNGILNGRSRLRPSSPWIPAAILLLLWCLGFRQIRLSDSAARDYATAVTIALAAVTALELFIWYGTRISYGGRMALTALGFGTVMIFTMTPLAIPDEQAHFNNTLRGLSLLFGWEYPAGLFDYTGLVGHFNVSSGYLRVARELFGTIPEGDTLVSLPGSPAYLPEYLPQMVGVGIGCLLRGNTMTVLLLGRLTNLLFYCLCVYTALRRTSVYRELLGTAALLPMALHQAASLSYDGFIMGLALVYTASIFRSREGTGLITRRELCRIAVSGVLLAPTRAVYVVLAGMFWLIPRERFPSARRRLLCFALLLGACISLTLGCQASTLSELGADTLNWEGTANYTVADILSDLPGTVRLFLVSFFRNVKHWISQAHGRLLAGLTLPMPRWLVGGFCAILLTTVLDTAPQGLPVGKKDRLLGALIILLVIGGMMLAMLLAWTSNTRDEIQGVQGRYFLPVLPLAYWLLSSKRALLRGKTAPFRCPVMLILLMEMIFYVLYYTLAN